MMRWLSTDQAGREGKLVVEKMELDETGFPQPTGELEELEADSVVLALGQDADLSLLEGVAGIEVEDGVVQVGPEHDDRTPGIFAGGDMVPAERTVTVGDRPRQEGGAQHRRLAARARHTSRRPSTRSPAFDMLNTWYYSDAPRTVQPQLEIERRRSTFDEVVGGLDESNALYEARRCLSCGNCFSCDNCYRRLPRQRRDQARRAGRATYAIDLDFCKGCGLCVAECPCGAIEMVPEKI